VKIDRVDFFYLSMPQVHDVGDGGQDALLVRLCADGFDGWGECEASPLTSIAAFVCPMSHSACKPVRDVVLGRRLDGPEDIEHIGQLVHANCFDLLQAPHTYSGIDIAMWDLLGKRENSPVYRLLGDKRATPKVPYASQLFGDTPEATFEAAQRVRRMGFRAGKFGWGCFGKGGVEQDRSHVDAARSGLGPDAALMIDAGTVWGSDVEAAKKRLPALERNRVIWLEEPFRGGALAAYSRLAECTDTVRLAGGEGAHNPDVARHLIDHGKIGFVQIDTGRIGGITPARGIADYARTCGVTYVNHTFTTCLALSASLQPYAGSQRDTWCEYPLEPTQLARELTREQFAILEDGTVRLPEAPGLGVTPDRQTIERYLVDARITVRGRTIYETPDF